MSMRNGMLSIIQELGNSARNVSNQLDDVRMIHCGVMKKNLFVRIAGVG
jgi:hypothetical protein